MGGKKIYISSNQATRERWKLLKGKQFRKVEMTKEGKVIQAQHRGPNPSVGQVPLLVVNKEVMSLYWIYCVWTRLMLCKASVT